MGWWGMNAERGAEPNGTRSALGLRMRVALKRLIDIVVAGVLLLLLLPLMVLIALAVLIRSGRPILFRQIRVGRYGKHFQMLKFRTMSVGAEAQMAELAQDNVRTGPLFKINNDPRVTPVGRVLRRASLDELPQLFNVLAGTMSLVGPRPALPDEVDEFPASLRIRESVPQGLTGLWQVVGRTDTEFATYEELDIRYVNTWTVRRDLLIMLRTPFAIVKHAFMHSPVDLPTGLSSSDSVTSLDGDRTD